MHRMIAIRRRRRTPLLLLLELHRTTIPVALLLLILQHCCPALHHHNNAAQAFISGSTPSSSFFARHHHQSAFSVHSSFSSPSPCGGSGFRAFSLARSRHQNAITTTLLTANIDAIRDKDSHDDTGSSNSDLAFSEDSFRVDDEQQRTYKNKNPQRKPSAVSSKGKDLRPARGKTRIGWKAHFQLLQEFQKEHGHCQVPPKHSVNNVNLGNWVKSQRQHYRKYQEGQYSPMTQERIDALETLGFNWSTARSGWEGHFQKLVEYKELHGHCQVPSNYSVDDVNLGTWATTQRCNYRKYLKGKYSPMSQERIDQLNSVGFDWGTTAMIGWEGTFEKLVQFKELHGHCRVPQNHCVDDISLGTWVSTQRYNYRKYLKGKYSPMTQARIYQLNSIGFDWGTAMIGWEVHFQKLVQFKESHGHCRVPRNYTADDVNLGNWVSSQRQEYLSLREGQHSTMTQERIDALEKVGFDWGRYNTEWEAYLQLVQEFHAEHGHCRVPRNHSVNHVKLGKWVSNQRSAYKSFKDGQHSTMTQERIDALEKIGFVWKLQIGWEANFQLLQDFQKEHGHCRVPRYHCVDDVNLGVWVDNQRRFYRKYLAGKYSPMTQEQMDQLNSIGFYWGKPKIGWEAQFRLLTEFQKENGHCRVPEKYSVDNVKLGRWVSNQRIELKNFKDGKSSSMTQERMDQLNSIGFRWGKPQIGWEAQFRLLTEFQKENGHCRVPEKYSVNNVRLGKWVHQQRFQYKKFKDGKPSPMTQERINQLNAIGFN